MFGYFLRHVDMRFQLEAALGVLDERSQEEAVARLERLFAQVSISPALCLPSPFNPLPIKNVETFKLVDVLG
jgi:hypothetical protein